MKRESALWLGLGAVAVGGSAAAMAQRARFHRRLRATARELALPVVPAPNPRALPSEVARLAQRLGVSDSSHPAMVRMRQTGTIRQSSAGGEMNFRAVQTTAVARTGFVWHATCAPLRMLEIADYLAPSGAALEARAFGAIPVAVVAAEDSVVKGELGRYLAELAWAPDAIVLNQEIEWRVLDEGALQAACGEGARRAAVRLQLDERGLIASAEMADRPRWENGGMSECRWRGRFRDYEEIEGRMIPRRGEASWFDGEREWVTWRGRVVEWSTSPRRA